MRAFIFSLKQTGVPVGGAMAGAGLGFLWFNAYPAQVFMGDTGSLPLGGLMLARASRGPASERLRVGPDWFGDSVDDRAEDPDRRGRGRRWR